MANDWYIFNPHWFTVRNASSQYNQVTNYVPTSLKHLSNQLLCKILFTYVSNSNITNTKIILKVSTNLNTLCYLKRINRVFTNYNISPTISYSKSSSYMFQILGLYESTISQPFLKFTITNTNMCQRFLEISNKMRYL